MWPPCDRRTEIIRAAAAGPLDWARFLRVVRRHRVLGLVHHGLKWAWPDVPPDIVKQISAQAATLFRDNLAMAAEAVRVQRLFDEAKLPVLFIKGTSLAVLAFGNLGLRAGKDIDLLIPCGLLWEAVGLLESGGYRRFDPPPDISDTSMRLLMTIRKDLGFIHEKTGQQIELHWRLFLNPHVMDETSFLAASRVVPLTGTSGLRTLGEEDLFTYLCVHGALHCWYQLKWVADIGALLAATPQSGAERLYRAAEARGARHAAAQSMLLCERLLNRPLRISLKKQLSSRKVQWLQETALSAMTVGGGVLEPREVRFGTTRGRLSAFFLGQGWRYCLTELRNVLINETDVLAVPLPERLRFLYPIMRLPRWLWRHASRREAERPEPKASSAR
jgi:hypothetical protein